MKIRHTHTARRHEDGIATIIFIVLLAIMMILIMAQSRALYTLHGNVKLLEKQQIKRLNAASTNAVAAIHFEAK